jgi:anthranilate synthase/aminodeoxychorismate synthase-like glutamine amidotransferase
VRRNDDVTVDEVEKLSPDRIVISPGPGVPNEAGVSLQVIEEFGGKVPILGVCLGHQAIGQAFGGRVVRAAHLVHGKSSTVQHDRKTIFEDLEQNFSAGRYHSLVVERESLPDCLEVSATTPNGTIMGLRHRKMKIEGVQFHPESIMTTEGKKLLANFLKL